MKSPICVIKAFWNFASGNGDVSAHSYELTKEVKSATVTILTCKDCGEVSIGWKEN